MRQPIVIAVARTLALGEEAVGGLVGEPGAVAKAVVEAVMRREGIKIRGDNHGETEAGLLAETEEYRGVEEAAGGDISKERTERRKASRHPTKVVSKNIL
jgi:hypothetical protein